MKFIEIVERKLQKEQLSKSDFLYIIDGFLKGAFSEIQMITFLKTIIKIGLSNSEIYDLTKVMQNAGGGKTLNLTDFGIVADKHSTGGVSDSTSLLVVPIVASANVKILKMSGKGLGFTGGTADKILVFDGLENEMSIERGLKILTKTNGCFITQSEKIAPADKKIYDLRDKADLIESIPLIATSIASKKLASGGNVVVFDVKFGQGAFIKTFKEAVQLGKIMTNIMKKEGKKTCAVISSMNEPLGNFIGDYLEVQEVVKILKSQNKVNQGQSYEKEINFELLELSEVLSALIIKFAKNISFKKARQEVRFVLESGKALAKLKEIISAQGGSLKLFDENVDFHKIKIVSEQVGIIKKLGTKKLGHLTRLYTEKYSDFLGIEILMRRGKKLQSDTVLAKLYFKKNMKVGKNMTNEIISNYKECFQIASKSYCLKEKLIKKIIY